MDTARLRDLAASYRSRAEASNHELARNYENDMAAYLESVVAWIEARQAEGAGEANTAPRNGSGAKSVSR